MVMGKCFSSLVETGWLGFDCEARSPACPGTSHRGTASTKGVLHSQHTMGLNSQCWLPLASEEQPALLFLSQEYSNLCSPPSPEYLRRTASTGCLSWRGTAPPAGAFPLLPQFLPSWDWGRLDLQLSREQSALAVSGQGPLQAGCPPPLTWQGGGVKLW